jgi:hypothetical protein
MSVEGGFESGGEVSQRAVLRRLLKKMENNPMHSRNADSA